MSLILPRKANLCGETWGQRQEWRSSFYAALLGSGMGSGNTYMSGVNNPCFHATPRVSSIPVCGSILRLVLSLENILGSIIILKMETWLVDYRLYQFTGHHQSAIYGLCLGERTRHSDSRTL